jgi:hypothetical protein
VAASLSISDTESGEEVPVPDRIVGGNWHGSPSKTRDRQLFVDVRGIREAGSTL